MTNKADRQITVVGLGEALFDRFPDQTILGGAPLNLAVQAHQILSIFGGQGTVVSRVGADELGDQLINELESRGICTDYVQRDPDRRTGDVVVKTDEDGDATYTITADAAWDAMDFDTSLANLAQSCSAVCYGTLAQRSPQSRKAIHEFIGAADNALRVCDVNLRQDFYDEDVLRSSIAAANVVKLNEEELTRVSELLPLVDASMDQNALAKKLLHSFGLRLVALTRGAQGTTLISADQCVTGVVPNLPSSPGSDTVGAGDASCAGLICGVLLDWTLQDTLDLSNLMGAFVASRAGATPELTDELRERVRSIVA